MKSVLLGSAAAVLAAGLAFAQTTPSSVPPAGTTMGAPTTSDTAGAKAAASGDNNQAVATTDANADQPAKGANSFSRGQAMHRIEAKGFTKVRGLMKDSDGVWRGKAVKDGSPTHVWLDYKGNVGQQS